MALATTCPQCKTSFKVVPDQLKLRRGLVRCGVCQHVFSGIDYLRYVDDAARAAQRAARATAPSAGADELAARPAAAGDPSPPSGAPRAPTAGIGSQGPAGTIATVRGGGAEPPGAPFARTPPPEAHPATDAPSAHGAASASGTPPAPVTAPPADTWSDPGAPERIALPTAATTTETPPGTPPAGTPTLGTPPAGALPSGTLPPGTLPPGTPPPGTLPPDAADARAGSRPGASGTDADTPADLPARDPWIAAAHAAHERSLRDEGPAAGGLVQVASPGPLRPSAASPADDVASVVGRAVPPWPPASGPQTLIGSDDDLKTAFFLTDSSFGPLPGEQPDPVPPTSIQHDGPAAPASTPQGGSVAPTATPHDGATASASTPHDGTSARTPTPHDGTSARTSTPHDGTRAWTSTPHDGTSARTPTPHDGAAAPTSIRHDDPAPPTIVRAAPVEGALPLRPEGPATRLLRESVDLAPATAADAQARSPFVVDDPAREPDLAPPPVDTEAAIDPFAGRYRRSRGLGLALSPVAWVGAAVLVLALAAQAVVGWRDRIAAAVPAAAPVLAAVLSPFGLTIGPPRDLDALTIESFELQAAGAPNVLQLTAVLRNRSGHVVGFPAMELSLTDSTGALLVRKVIPADAYVAGTDTIRDGLAPRTERPLRVALEHAGLRPTGYAVALFYP